MSPTYTNKKTIELYPALEPNWFWGKETDGIVVILKGQAVACTVIYGQRIYSSDISSSDKTVVEKIIGNIN